MKALAITETLLIIGMSAIAITMFTQVPSEVKELAGLLALSSANAISKDVAGLLAVTAIAPGDIAIQYDFPERFTYDLSVQRNYVVLDVISPEQDIEVEDSSAKSAPKLKEELEDVRKIEISKNSRMSLLGVSNRYDIDEIQVYVVSRVSCKTDSYCANLLGKSYKCVNGRCTAKTTELLDDLKQGFLGIGMGIDEIDYFITGLKERDFANIGDVDIRDMIDEAKDRFDMGEGIADKIPGIIQKILPGR